MHVHGRVCACTCGAATPRSRQPPLLPPRHVVWKYFLPWVGWAKTDELSQEEQQTEELDQKGMRYLRHDILHTFPRPAPTLPRDPLMTSLPHDLSPA